MNLLLADWRLEACAFAGLAFAALLSRTLFVPLLVRLGGIGGLGKGGKDVATKGSTAALALVIAVFLGAGSTTASATGFMLVLLSDARE
ncbi:MAG: hypothetical protein OXR62_14510 [Ahrensia sp.]|nr:hypothetical protein [Ahrensia sp.]